LLNNSHNFSPPQLIRCCQITAATATTTTTTLIIAVVVVVVVVSRQSNGLAYCLPTLVVGQATDYRKWSLLGGASNIRN